MQKSDNKPYALLAGVCYAIHGLYYMINLITYVQNTEYASITAREIIVLIAMIGMAVALFLKNEKIVVAAAGANALLHLYFLTSYFSLWSLFDFIAYALIVVLILLTLRKNAVVQKIWFASGAALLLGELINWIDYGYFSYISVTWGLILFSLVEVGGLILIGLWVKEHDFVLSKDEPTNEYSKFDSQTVYSAPLSDTAIGGADKLKMYSELLESGTITQEEFDAKKKQVLGLYFGDMLWKKE